ncbi:MAG: DUF817 domain-containing protein [Cyclobacteriaceae bacterium]
MLSALNARRTHRRVLQLLAYEPGAPAPERYSRELLAFGYRQAISCVFPVFIFGMLSLSHVLSPAWLPRYDFLLLACIGMQAYMYYAGLESKREVLVITVFHMLGLIMEIHKVNVGSWSYPEEAYTKIGGVPLYSGFMYASVASYICQAWKRLDLKMIRWPVAWLSTLVAIAIYGNFMTNAYLPDVRWYITAAIVIVFWRTKVSYATICRKRRMPMIVAFLLIGFFLWLAENIATFLGAWKYAYQHAGWQMVDWHKYTSWSLLIIVSIIIVSQLKIKKYSILTWWYSLREEKKEEAIREKV